MLEESKKTEGSTIVDLASLSDLTGFPVALIKKELFEQNDASTKMSLEDLREAMVSYIDKAMLLEP
jgi:hypothetical protein